MKLNAGKRILMFFHWLLSLLICVAFAAYIIKPDFVTDIYSQLTAGLTRMQVMVIGIAILAIYTVLTVIQACMIFHRTKRADRGFITVDASDTGKVRITVSAIEQMVRQSVHNIDGIADMKIGIENMDDAIGIDIAATIVNGSHVPTITMNMQRAIRQFVEMNCGVAVRTVSININSVASAADGSKRRRGRRADGIASSLAQKTGAPAIVPTAAQTPDVPLTAQAQDTPVYTPAEPVRPAAPVVSTEPAPVADEAPVGLNRPITLTLDPPAPAEASGFEAEPIQDDDVHYGSSFESNENAGAEGDADKRFEEIEEQPYPDED